MDAIIAFSVLLLLILGGLWVHFAVGAAALGYLWLMKGFAGWNALGMVSWGHPTASL
ncbi:hypothetical protein HSBAA_61840 [Vreelandella sulfidaeris]|uniref:TRAP C4-dicarboxylate transport system permease DctM subunit domain-containing protein n=1 Tax=Vreelandella sulfidaeris TaxID=115553 RepID=A0A455UKK4_9GAMM|nr:hypothetical protein HSBAA_61840 [Halomonas sulfidaeris]